MSTKLSFPCVFLAAAGWLLAVSAAPALAGSAVASDNHGGFGYSFGDRPTEQLEREATQRCREKSGHPDDVHVVVSSRRRGAGVVVRYSVDGRAHIYAYVGAEDARQAEKYATDYVQGYGGHQIEVVARWQD